MRALGAVQQTVIDVLKEVSRRPIEPTLESDLVADLGFDSLQVMEVLAELEGRFDIAIPLDEVTATRTVAQVVGALRRWSTAGRTPDGSAAYSSQKPSSRPHNRARDTRLAASRPSLDVRMRKC